MKQLSTDWNPSRFKIVITLESIVVSLSYELRWDGTQILWDLKTAQAGARGQEGCCTYSLSLMSRLNQTDSAILL
jgi:hypothetical protein